MRKKLKVAAAFFGILSLVGLLGCQSSKATAKQVEARLEDKYGEKFEVIALGNRWGTKTNDTVTTIVTAVKNKVVFEAVMGKDGKIESENYLPRKVGTDVSNLLMENFKQESIESQPKLFIVGGKKLHYDSSDINIHEYIESHSPEYFVGKVILKEGNFKPENVVNTYKTTYSELLDTPVKTNIWVISEEDYEKAVKDFNENPDVSKEFFDKYNITSKFHLHITSDGIDTNREEIKKSL